MDTATAYDTTPELTQSEQAYAELLTLMQSRIDAAAKQGLKLFTTDASDKGGGGDGKLFEAYLSGFPAYARQYHNCHACRRFVETYGGLVVIDSAGKQTPLFWEARATPLYYRVSVENVERLVRRAKVTGVFVSSESVWGVPEAGGWTHFAVKVPAAYSRVQSAYRASRAQGKLPQRRDRTADLQPRPKEYGNG
jgi:hypothetical protein